MAECLVLNRIPTEADAEAETPLSQQIQLGSLLGHERGLALGHDDDRGCELELRDASEEAKHHHRLVEGRVDRVRTAPALMHGRIRTNNVVVGDQMLVAELLDSLGIGAQVGNGPADLGLGECHANLHGVSVPAAAVTTRGATPASDCLRRQERGVRWRTN